MTRDYGETANEKANELLYHLGLATLSIIVLVWLAIGCREAMVVAVVIPVTILLTLFASRVMGYTLNRVSLFALIFSIGILVDDAIVVIENIARHWGMGDGRDRKQAAIEAVAEVGNPTIVATLTVVAALLPMLFVSGMMGPYMSPIPANASAAMIFSFFVAVIVTPWLMLKIAGKAPVPCAMSDHAQRRHARPRLCRRRPADPVVEAGKLGIPAGRSALLTLGSLSLFYTKDVTVKLLPFDNKSELSVMIDLPEGSSVEATDAVAQDVARIVLGTARKCISVQTHAGTAAPFNFNGLVRHSFCAPSRSRAMSRINLPPKGERDRSSHEIALDIRERIAAIAVPPGTSLKVVEPPPGPPVMATLLAEIYGPDAETRRKVAAKVEAAFRSVPFIVDIDNSYGVGRARLRATISTDDLEFFHVEESDVFDTIAILNGGRRRLFASRRAVASRSRSASNGQGRSTLDERFLTTPIPANVLPGDRGVVELGDVVQVSARTRLLPGLPPQWPRRRNGDGRTRRRLRGAALRHARRAAGHRRAGLDGPAQAGRSRCMASRRTRARSTLLWDGEWEVTWVTFRDMGAAFIVALLGIYILVVAQFGSFKVPLVILTPIPLTFIGILGGHWLFGAPFSATSMIGFIALAGIIVRNSILLVDFIRHADRDGRPLTEILIEAGAIRFKPILLTALAAMIGAAVILTDPIFQGLAISLLFGLASSTLLTVLVIPAIYRVLRT